MEVILTHEKRLERVFSFVKADEDRSNLCSRSAQTRGRICHQEAAFLSSRTRSASPAASHTGMRVKGRTCDPDDDDDAIQPLGVSANPPHPASHIPLRIIAVFCHDEDEVAFSF